MKTTGSKIIKTKALKITFTTLLNTLSFTELILNISKDPNYIIIAIIPYA